MTVRKLTVEGERIELPCSGCSGTVVFMTGGDNPTFFHTMPYCERFNSTNTVDDLIVYMHECAAKRVS